MKVAINKCYGGFCLSKEAYDFLGLEWDDYGFAYNNTQSRADKDLIKCIETLGKKANGSFADIKIVEIPDDVNWGIDDYDGIEHVYELHRTWL